MAEHENLNLNPSSEIDKVIFICSVCSRHFPSLDEAQNHPDCYSTETGQEDAELNPAEVEEAVVQVKVEEALEEQEQYICNVCNSMFADEASLAFHSKIHELESKQSDETKQPEVPELLDEKKKHYLKIETDQGEFCVELNESDLYNLSKQKMALDLDSIANLKSAIQSADGTDHKNPEPLGYFKNRNYVLDLLQEKTKSKTPLLIDASTKMNKPVNKVIDEIIKRNESITNANFTNIKTKGNSMVLNSGKNKPVNQIIDDIIKRNENVTSRLPPFIPRPTIERHSSQPVVTPDNPSPVTIQSALSQHIQPGNRIQIGDTLYEILYADQDENQTSQSTPAVSQPDSDVMYVMNPDTSSSQNSVVSIPSVNTSLSSSQSNEILTPSSQSKTLSLLQNSSILTNSAHNSGVQQLQGSNSGVQQLQGSNSGVQQLQGSNSPNLAGNYFVINSSNENQTNNGSQNSTTSRIGRPPNTVRSLLYAKQQQTSIPKVISVGSDITGQKEEKPLEFIPAPAKLEPDDVLPERGSMPDDLYNQIMSHLTQPRNRYQKCHYCFRSFATELKLLQHIEDEHPDIDGSKVCHICNEQFKSEPGYKCHMTMVHGKDGDEKITKITSQSEVQNIHKRLKLDKTQKKTTFQVEHVKSI